MPVFCYSDSRLERIANLTAIPTFVLFVFESPVVLCPELDQLVYVRGDGPLFAAVQTLDVVEPDTLGLF